MRNFLLFAPLLLIACDPLGVRERERYVIMETSPFYEAQVSYDAETVDDVVLAVTMFADRHNMDLLAAHRSLTEGRFNVSANGPTLNLRAIHTSIEPGVQVYAYSRDEPTDRDWELVREFESVVRRASEGEPTN